METRKTRPQDWPAIRALVNRARFTSPTLWRWAPHLADDGFVVVEIEGSIEGALLASPDESPVAWVRFAAVGDELDVGQWLAVSLPLIIDHLRTLEVRELAWMDHGGWAAPSLETRGFTQLTEVITLTKADRAVPDIEMPPVTVRPASNDDIGDIAAIDRRAFTPTWWRSQDSIRRRATTASRFTIAEREHKVVGYAERELHLPAAHLNRIAVDPQYQGRGIGAFLLKRVLISLWQADAEAVSLNTQRTNHRSRRLYARFGFKPTGDSVTVWTRRV